MNIEKVSFDSLQKSPSCRLVQTLASKLKASPISAICWFDLIIFSSGCATSEDLFWKLDALQSFIRELHWPDPEFGLHLNQRLKLMACDMIESSIQR